MLLKIAHAAHHAHERGIVHRDLKPANILLQSATPTESTADLGSLNPILADFGLAKRLDSDSTAWTQEGAVVGTVSYMAPEQAAGRIGELGPPVDVYALGAVLYELLTGRPPFQASSWSEMIRQVLHDEPLPPRRLRPDVPLDLETICLQCLEKDPGRRYSRAADLADDLSRFLEGRPVVAVPPGEHERMTRQAARDGYEIVGEIGRGPRSAVYRALDQPLRQSVALKVFEAGICTREEWEARLESSKVVRAALTHPQIVPFRRAGWWNEAPYVEMEFVPHGNLSSRMTSRASPPGSAVRLVGQLAEIVCYMHRQGVVHGNLKPNNILLAADGIPRVSDLRLTGWQFLGALPAAEQAPDSLTYLPPELVRDPGTDLRPTMDVYSLGAILYELLTGRLPFAGQITPNSGNETPLPEWVPPSRFNPEVTPQLDRICSRCLRQNPWQRYTRAYNLLTSLRSFLEDPGGRRPSRRRQRPLPDV
jgi:serine/threonine protein kinase